MAEHIGIVVQLKADGSARVAADRIGGPAGMASNVINAGCYG